MDETEKCRTPKDPALSPVTATAKHHQDGFVSDHSDRWRQRERQRVAWRRRPWLDCGCSDDCRCEWRDNPSEKRVDGYRDAIAHLAELGYCAAALTPELRALWRRGGSDRRIAEQINDRRSA